MTDWRDTNRDDMRRDPRRGRELAPAPWRAREDHDVERGFGEGEFERGGRPSGGYAQGGYNHLRDDNPDMGQRRARGYGSYGGGAYRERRSFAGGRSARSDERLVREVMTPHAEVLDPDTNLRDAARRMRADKFGAYPVGEFDRLIGMITDRDIVVRAVAEDRRPSRTTVREVMTRQMIYCFDDDDIEDVAGLMAEHQIRRIPVLNRDKRLVGMVALADLGLCGAEAARRALAGVSEPTGVPRR